MARAIIDRGLNLSVPDETHDNEIEEFREFYTRTKGYALPAFEFWLDERPDVLKRYRLQARQTPSEEALQLPLANTLAFLHYYSIVGYEDGILYEVRNCESIGAPKQALLETLAVAFLHAGPRGMRYVATSSREYLAGYVDPHVSAPLFPDSWDVDTEATKAGLDYSVEILSAKEYLSLEEWYMRWAGEVPRFVTSLGKHRPNLLKAYRHRWEYALQGALPKQMLPYLMIHFDVIRGFRDGIRDAVLLARGFGMNKTQIHDAISWGMLYGGPSAVSVVDEAVGKLLDSWEDQ